MAYFSTLINGVLSVERAKMRGWSAVRRGMVVILVFLVFGAIYDMEVGALASVAALYVGLQDRASDPLAYTVRVMTLETFILAAVAAVAGFAAHTWIPGAVLVLCAGLAGLTAGHDKAISRMFTDIIAVEAFLGLTHVSMQTGFDYIVAILVAGLLQTALTRLAFRYQSDLPERRPVAAALRAVSDHLDDAQHRRRSGTGEIAELALDKADASVVKSDLSHARRRALRKLLGDAEALREEASALRARRAFETEVIADDEVDDAVDLAVVTLRVAARAITLVPRVGIPDSRLEADLRQLKELSSVADSIVTNKHRRPSARAIARDAQRTASHVVRLLGTTDTREKLTGRSVRKQLWRDLRDPSRADLLTAGRLALAAVVSLSIASWMNLPHGGWVAATSVALLRPDYRALTVDTVARAFGTALGALAVLPMVLVTNGHFWFEVLVLAILAILTFAVTAANEGLFIIAITVETVYTRAAVGENPMAAAQSRLLDVLLGCGIAVAMLLILPLKHGRRLRRELHDYALATADWLDEVARLAGGKKAKGFKKLHRRVRLTRVNVQHGLDVRKVEPLGAGLPPWWAHRFFGHIHDVERVAVAAETSLNHGADQTKCAKKLARVAAADLRAAADALYGRETSEPITPPDLVKPNAIENLLEIAVREAHEARNMASEAVLVSK